MREELYINGQSVDLGESVNITLNYTSNMITDLNKIVGNNSYTIKLPKTKRNIGIIGISDIPSVVKSFPRVAHPCRYFRNGVEIVSDGRAVLLAVSDYIEVVMTWGSTAALSKMVEDNRTLDDFENIPDSMEWETGTGRSVYDESANIMYADISWGLYGLSEFAAIHPSVRSTYIFNLIKDKYGLSVEFPDDKDAFIRRMIIPLVTRNGGYANRMDNRAVVEEREDGERVVIEYGASHDRYFEAPVSFYGNYPFKVLITGKVVITPSFKSKSTEASVGYGVDPYNDNTVYFPYEIGRENGESVYIYNKPVEIDLAAEDSFVVRIPDDHTMIGTNTAVFSYGSQPNEIVPGDRFPIVENLPSIKVVDFIKAICSLTGLFAVPSSDGSMLKFVSFDSLADKSQALDWSDKLLPNDRNNRPKSIGYTLDDFARNNRMRWKEDSRVAVNADGNIIVDDMTLEIERDAVTLPFAPTDMSGYHAVIRAYEYNDDGEPELQDVEPRLLLEYNSGGYSVGTFNGLQFGSIIAEYYKTYQNTVKSPKILTETIRLDEFTLKDLDVSKPIYLRQYGKYYAIVEVKAPSTGICECKLLQLED